MSKHLRELIEAIFKSNAEYRQLKGLRNIQRFGAAASIAEVVELERRRLIDLPNDYRSFLLTHNGWLQFEGQMDLLSTSQMQERSMIENFAYVGRLALDEGDEGPARGFVFQGCATSADIVYLDREPKQDPHNPEVARWEYEEVGRYTSFTTYLEHSLKVRGLLISGELERLRK